MKISKGARRHLLRTVEKLEFPMFIVYAPARGIWGPWKAIALAHEFKRAIPT